MAADTGHSLKDLIEDAMCTLYAQDKAPRSGLIAERVIAYKGRRVQPRVNLDSMRELMDIMGGQS
jgi:hypothetical protein